MSFKYIEEVEEVPEMPKYYKSTAREIIEEFLRSKMNKARVAYEKVKDDYKSTGYLARALGGVIKRMNLDKEIKVFSHGDYVYIVKTGEK